MTGARVIDHPSAAVAGTIVDLQRAAYDDLAEGVTIQRLRRQP